MTLLVLLGVCLLWLALAAIVKDLHAQAKDRRDERIMAAYQRQEAARMHAWNLTRIEQIRQAAAEEMLRAASDAGDQVIEGTATEIEHR